MISHLIHHRKNLSNQKAFTLVELLVVIGIIGLLAAVTLTATANARVSARDTKRRADISQMQKALELYYSTNGRYPISNAYAPFPYWVHSNTANWTSMQTAMSAVISKLPTDPNQTPTGSVYDTPTVFAYGYYSMGLGGCENGQWYIIVFKLERPPNPASPGGYDCNASGYYNYTAGGNNVTLVVRATR